jgi:hypothetical protein
MSWLTVIFVIAKLFGKFPHSWLIIAVIAFIIDEFSKRRQRRRKLKEFLNRTR